MKRREEETWSEDDVDESEYDTWEYLEVNDDLD